MIDEKPMAWLPHSIAEAALSGGGVDVDLPTAWTHLLERLKIAGELVASDPVNRNRIDYGSGMRHLMVLLAVGIDEALRQSRRRRAGSGMRTASSSSIAFARAPFRVAFLWTRSASAI